MSNEYMDYGHIWLENRAVLALLTVFCTGSLFWFFVLGRDLLRRVPYANRTCGP
jgi:hypothetical protein